MPTSERRAPAGQKRLLALDGGGIRGTIPLEFLFRREAVLRHRLGSGDDFVLADYFDYVADRANAERQVAAEHFDGFGGE